MVRYGLAPKTLIAFANISEGAKRRLTNPLQCYILYSIGSVP
jgi:hypothetical protein